MEDKKRKRRHKNRPIYKHACKLCRYLGTLMHVDYYVCTSEKHEPVIVRRFGHRPNDWSQMADEGSDRKYLTKINPLLVAIYDTYIKRLIEEDNE